MQVYCGTISITAAAVICRDEWLSPHRLVEPCFRCRVLSASSRRQWDFERVGLASVRSVAWTGRAVSQFRGAILRRTAPTVKYVYRCPQPYASVGAINDLRHPPTGQLKFVCHRSQGAFALISRPDLDTLFDLVLEVLLVCAPVDALRFLTHFRIKARNIKPAQYPI